MTNDRAHQSLKTLSMAEAEQVSGGHAPDIPPDNRPFPPLMIDCPPIIRPPKPFPYCTCLPVPAKS